MQCCALAQDFYPWCCGITIDLFYCILPLCLGFCLKILGWQHLQFDDVAMLGRIVGQVGQEKEITIAVIQLKFESRNVIAAQVEICHEETLQVALGFDAISY